MIVGSYSVSHRFNMADGKDTYKQAKRVQSG